MPSPFPGMDPYLEHPAFFPGLHDSMIIYLREYLQPRLPAPYFAETGDRVWVEVSQRFIEPDVDILRQQKGTTNGSESQGGVAVAPTARAKGVLVRIPHDERREPFLNIFSRRNDERLVCTIEVLSLTNKTPGEQGRDLYLRKQREILGSQTHLVEIDLLRAGQHTTAVARDQAILQTGPFEYHVCVHPYESIEDFFVHPIQLADRLPEFEIPLLPGDPPVTVDLQAVFERCYDTGPYSRRVRYAEMTPVPPLSAEQSEWAQRLLREKGLLPSP